MADVKVPVRLPSGAYAEISIAVEEQSPLSQEDLLSVLNHRMDDITIELGRKERVF